MDKSSRMYEPKGRRSEHRSLEQFKTDPKSRFSLPRGGQGSSRPSEPRRNNRISAPCVTIRESVGGRRSCSRTLGDIIPRMPRQNLQDLDPAVLCEHFEQAVDLDNYAYKGTFQEGINSAGLNANVDGKYFSVRQKPLSVKETYLIVIRHEWNGMFYCVWDDDTSKAQHLEMKQSLAKLYGGSGALSRATVNIDNLKVGEVVVAKVRDLHSKKGAVVDVFIRAIVKSVKKQASTAVVLNLDDYDIREVNAHVLYRIDRNFIDLEANMFTCKLGCLEFFAGTKIVHHVLEECPVPQPMGFVMYFLGHYTKDGKTPLVEITRLFDDNTSNVGKHVLTNLSAYLSPMKSLMEDKKHCEIVRCNQDGMLWLRFLSDDWIWDQVHARLQEISETFTSFRTLYPLSAHDCDKKMVYITDVSLKNNPLKEIRRVIIKETYLEKNEFKVLFIDRGGSCIVAASSILPLSIFDDTLPFIPPLVVKVHLEIVRRMKADISKIQSIIPGNCVIAKVVGENEVDQPPEVRILLPGNEQTDDFNEEELDMDDEDNGPDEGIAFSSKTLSGLLIREKLAITYEDV